EFQRIRDTVRQRPDGREAEDGAVTPSAARNLGPAARDPTQARDDILSWDTLKALNQSLLTFPDGFTINPKLDRALQRRRVAFEKPDAHVDWAHAEALAFASILQDATPIRLSGQDTVRGTFSQRHLSFYDVKTGAAYTPLTTLPQARASFEVHNTPVSETATLGFEYGYSVQAPDALVLWEAQYGDFINGAQVIVDEFVVSGQAKWGLESGLVLLLPHAWEGQGPDHSGARLERFLEMTAEDNIRVANCTTAAQYFWLLRRQAASLPNDPRPLIVMTPRTLLRHPLSASLSLELTRGRSHPVLDDARARQNPRRVRSVVLCSGHIWADLTSNERRAADDALAVIRLEELYPFPAEEL